MLGQPLLGEWGLLGMFCNDGSAGLQARGPAGHQGNLYFKKPYVYKQARWPELQKIFK